ncbi:FmdB family zinc ribbon protein [Deinococcus pimensis]|uniref:FmdB family zinc ribbon protein n=1 Tax=Deinococcus pimensis TaxID=309888 RepID=UPI0004801240|nr:FmdB family zinc ribbon protein [Deinococcus pimensis]
MPTYLYKSLDSGETFEIKQSMTEQPLTVHPETGEPIKRILATPGIAFKGPGFYVTDSRPKDKGGE